MLERVTFESMTRSVQAALDSCLFLNLDKDLLPAGTLLLIMQVNTFHRVMDSNFRHHTAPRGRVKTSKASIFDCIVIVEAMGHNSITVIAVDALVVFGATSSHEIAVTRKC